MFPLLSLVSKIWYTITRHRLSFTHTPSSVLEPAYFLLNYTFDWQRSRYLSLNILCLRNHSPLFHSHLLQVASHLEMPVQGIGYARYFTPHLHPDKYPHKGSIPMNRFTFLKDVANIYLASHLVLACKESTEVVNCYSTFVCARELSRFPAPISRGVEFNSET